MSINNILLVCAALFPAIALCIYIFIKDRVEKEPIGLLLGLFALGCVICFPAAEVESVLFAIIDKIFAPFAFQQNGVNVLDGTTFRIYNACKYFVGVALVEEGFKFLVLFLVTRKNKNFNSLFDGIIYAVFVSLGFAALENVFYVLEYGWRNAIMRAIMSVPGHMFFAVLMGYYYSMWHMYEKAKRMERTLKRDGLIPRNAPEFTGTTQMVLCLLVPTFAHGLYDYYCTIGTLFSIIALYAFLLFLYIYCFGRIRKMSKGDMIDSRFSSILVFNKYPHLIELIREKY